MRERRETVVELLEEVTDRQDLDRLVRSLGSIFEIQHTMYHVIGRSGGQIGMGTYSEDWQKNYVNLNYSRIDPVVRTCLHARDPVQWHQLDWSAPGAGRFMSDAIDAGVGSLGISMPMRGVDGQFSLFTLSSDVTVGEWEKHSSDFMSDMMFVAHLINEKGLEIVDGDVAASATNLSPRENDVLVLLGAGFTRTQAADYLGISEHTIRVYLETARRKLGAANTLHTVARAQTLGLLAL